MLDIGRANNGDYIIQMTEDERKMLSRLESAARGETFDWSRASNIIVITRLVDFAPWMQAVFAWTQARFCIADMQSAVDKFKRILEKSE